MGTVEIWTTGFLTGWEIAGNILAGLVGVLAAVIVAAVALGLLAVVVTAVLSACFDRATERLAKHWKKTGRVPGGKWAKIIAGGKKNEV